MSAFHHKFGLSILASMFLRRSKSEDYQFFGLQGWEFRLNPKRRLEIRFIPPVEMAVAINRRPIREEERS